MVVALLTTAPEISMMADSLRNHAATASDAASSASDTIETATTPLETGAAGVSVGIKSSPRCAVSAEGRKPNRYQYATRYAISRRMDVPWATIIIIATNLSTLAVLGATTYFRIKTVAAQFDDMRAHLAAQDKAAGKLAYRVDSVGRHADVRYIEQRIIADQGDTAEQARLRNKIARQAEAIQSSNVGDDIGR
jgi:hypothetical protein